MPDITRSDSTRSDASRPRVSFNRDVHVKRIASPRTASAYSLSADGSVLVPTPVRRQRPRTRKDVQREAQDVLKAAGSVGCRVTRATGFSSSEPDSTSSNENPKPNKFMSLDRKKLRKKDKKHNLDYLSLENKETKMTPPKPKLSLDAIKRKPLSPIIESPAVDYFQVKNESNVEKMKKALAEQAPTRPVRGLAVSGVAKSPGEISHNQNRPFSYTEPIAEAANSQATSPTCDVIYAQVVVSGSEEPRKTTVHTRVARAPDGTMTTALYGPNPGRQITQSSPRGSVAKVRTNNEYDTHDRPPDLQDLSLRRQILLTRSESQARERFNSIKRVQEPRSNRRADNNARYLGNDIAINDKFSTSLRKIPKDVELITPVNSNTARRGKREVRGEDKTTTDNLLQRLSRLGKSKSFMEDQGSWGRGSKLERVKGLFRKRSTGTDSEEDPLSTRYSEYKGADFDSDRHVQSDPDYSGCDVRTRNRLSTPTSSRGSNDLGTLTRINNSKNKANHTNWFKSLDRLTKKGKLRSKSDGNQSDASKSSHLRFFGDTDQESTAENGNVGNRRDISSLKQRFGLNRTAAARNRGTDSDSDRPESRLTDSTIKGSSKSKYDLDRPDYGVKQMKYRLNNKSSNLSSNMSDTSTIKNGNYDYNLNGLKSGTSISRSMSSVTNSSRPNAKERLRSQRSIPLNSSALQEPLSPSRRVRSYGNLYRDRDTRRKLYDSSADSATEYDSVNSAKSTIYLHAATVGDIPGPRNLYRSEARSMSRDELSSTGRSSPLGGNKKTLSRSISVLAPWRPKFRQEASINYDSGNGSDFGRGKPPMGPVKKRSMSRERKPGEINFNTIGREYRRPKDIQRSH